MLDAQQLAQMVEQEIRTEVHNQVQQAVSQNTWIEDLETRIVSHVQDRITARFSNISTVPDLVETVRSSVESMFAQGFIPDLENYVEQSKITQAVDLATERFVEKIIDNLTIDPNWVTKIENLISQRVEQRIAARLREIDLNMTMADIVLTHKEELLQELRKDFRVNGIVDNATTTQLTIMDGHVVVENEFVSRDITIERDTLLKGNVLVQGSLGVQGKIAVDNETWQELSTYVGNVTYDRIKNDFANELIDTVISSAKQGIEIDNIMIGDSPLVSGNTLSHGIKKSGLETVGELQSLTVKGRTDLSNTITVSNNRVGINTQEPDNTVSIWDEDVNISLGKHAKNTAFVGTGRRNSLVLGTNRQNHIEINPEGLTTIQKLRVGRNNISWAPEIPNYSGTKGDVVFNTNLVNDAPFAWVCLGDYRWQSLKAAK